ncbi:alpha/beta hydrolase fold domain-containing protein [Mycetocola saprophilus]|uniref:alpha/beta hydrolase fold domain-containing protein n=1 Tax=Mycetocola saprophilus TaxID=76636 RepID=UPI003BF0B9B8
MVWAHGGSWHHGSAREWSRITGNLAARSMVTVLSVDYRLAPLHRHPAALLDMLNAIAWIRAGDPTAVISVGGDSVGATLAACAALVSRDRGEPLRAQVLAYPPTDPECRADSYYADPTAFPNPVVLRSHWRVWRGPATTPPRYAADGVTLPSTPCEAEHLGGVCPALLVVGDRDPVRDDVAVFAEELSLSGVDVDLRVLPGVGHADVLRPGSLVLATIAQELRSRHSPAQPERKRHR